VRSRYTLISKSPYRCVTLDEVKAHLRLPLAFDMEDVYLTQLINAAEYFFESATGMTTTRKTWVVYRTALSDLELQKRDLLLLDPIEADEEAEPPVEAYPGTYPKASLLISGAYQPTEDFTINDNTIPWAYVTFGTDASDLASSADSSAKQFRFEFSTGFGEYSSDVPEDIKLGVLHHVASMYANRGDCVEGSTDSGACAMPPIAKALYTKYKLHTLGCVMA